MRPFLGMLLRYVISFYFLLSSDSSNMLQQPNLGMLNPTLDELLEKLEPMEGLFFYFLIL